MCDMVSPFQEREERQSPKVAWGWLSASELGAVNPPDGTSYTTIVVVEGAFLSR